MKRIGFLSCYSVLNEKNRLFTDRNSLIGDDLHLPFVRLREACSDLAIEVETVTSSNIDIFDGYFLIDIPESYKKSKPIMKILESSKPKYLLLLECKHIMPTGYDVSIHEGFSKVFTWDEELITKDPTKYVKINGSHDLPVQIDLDILSRQKKISMITGNKCSTDKFELYSKRKEVISFYQAKGSGLDLFGLGWDGRCFNSKFISRVSNRIPLLKKIFYEVPAMYKGSVERKRPVLEKYQFSICFENRYGDYGYITEKIFDAMLSGSIPIYLGAVDISEHIPKECFIDMRQFDSILDLDQYLFSLGDESILEYQRSISSFLNSKQSKAFSIDVFVQTLLENIPSESVI